MADNRLIAVDIDQTSLAANGPDAEHERRVAIFDLLEKNSFALIGHAEGGPYRLGLGEKDRKLVFDIHSEDGELVYSLHFFAFSVSRRYSRLFPDLRKLS